MKEFRDRVAVVTGGASGIGKALAKAFLGEGMKVVIADVEEPALKSASEELGSGVLGVVTDVSDPLSVQALADQVFDTHGACHILCNNAGVAAPNLDLWETEPSDFQWVHGVNVHGGEFLRVISTSCPCLERTAHLHDLRLERCEVLEEREGGGRPRPPII